jgi:hypothetical protein
MSQSQLDPTDFNRLVSLFEKGAHDEAVRANEAFSAAMNREIKRGKVKVIPGTFVDTTPHLGARRIYGEAPISALRFAGCDVHGSQRRSEWAADASIGVRDDRHNLDGQASPKRAR